ncbi:MAG TPA: ABC transporter substrate-binding protein [Alphaproteobacteria bacterium]|nr:ABC transporter substrate-binding protein [Alphaproteobacteria bacterium]
MKRSARLALSLLLGFLASAARAAPAESWDDILAKARGETVYWNAWAGDEKTNAFIAWVGQEVHERFALTLRHVPLRDTAEAVTRVVAEKAAGRDADGSVDLIWINGPNFLAMKEQHLLYGPFTQLLPNIRLVDTAHKPSTVVDFTVPTGGMESPWRMAQIVFVYDSARLREVPRAIPAFLPWAKRHPGRFAHASVRNFLGATFLKQALYELTPDPSVLQQPASDANFEAVTAPLWAWYDELRPLLWREGKAFPESGPATRQLLDDGEIDMMMSFNPAEAAVAINAGLLPETVRTFVLARGTIGNTSFVAIPYNSPHKEGAMVIANFLLEPPAQAHAEDIRQMGNLTVLELAKLAPEARKLFADLPASPALPTIEELGTMLLEPHPSWMTRIVAEWEKRYTR